jgi:hypothetical protein
LQVASDRRSEFAQGAAFVSLVAAPLSPKAYNLKGKSVD